MYIHMPDTGKLHSHVIMWLCLLYDICNGAQSMVCVCMCVRVCVCAIVWIEYLATPY